MSRVHPLRAAGVGALLGLGLAYPVAQHYTTSGGSGTSVAGATVSTSSGTVGTAPRASPSGAGSGPAPSGGSSGTAAPGKQVLKATGGVVQTRYGPVQVRITVVASGGHDRITGMRTVSLPSGGRSGQISSFAGPSLVKEAMAAQSAKVQTVSGASYTSDGFRSSLQSALLAVRAAETKAGG